MVRSARAALVTVAFLVLVTTAFPAASAADPTEMEILDLYLAQFDGSADAQGQEVSKVHDRCHRTGGTEDTSVLPVVAGAAATNALMLQHVQWHGERGRLLEPVFTWSDSDPYGREFVEYHADLVLTYEGWRRQNGYPALVAWDPSTPIPAAFAYPVEAPCLSRESEDPQIALPTFLTVAGGSDASPFWGYTALCEIPDVNRLGKTIEGSWYHADVHLAVGGDMAEAGLTLRDPVFWPWHIHVQGIVETWLACGTQPSTGAAETGTRATPGVAMPLVMAALAWAAWRTKRA